MTTTKKLASPLSRKATLLSVTVSQWTARKLDKRVTRETNENYGATEDAGRYNKLLIGAEHLTKIHSLISQARDLHYRLTKPWVDKGPRILPNTLYAQFAKEFRPLKREFDSEVETFCSNYPEYVAERKRAWTQQSKKNGGMFDPADYPDPEDIRSKFAMDYSIVPFPDVGDFRSDLDEDTAKDIRAEIEAGFTTINDDVAHHNAKQIIEVVGHMAEKLKEYSQPRADGERRFFLDSLVDNVRKLAELLPAFNLTDDPKLTAITKRIAKELCTEDAAELRKNDEARDSVAKSADEIVAEMEKFLA